MKYSEKKAADREAMEKKLLEAIRASGASVSREQEFVLPREIKLNVVARGGLECCIEFDGASAQPDVYVLPWHIKHPSDARLNDAFGRAAGGSVNPHHHAKCTAVAYGFEDLLTKVVAALELAQSGAGFLPEGNP